MSHYTKFGVLLCGLLIAYVGCRKEPVAPSSSSPTTRSGEGPALAPPLQPSAGAPQGEDNSAGKTSSTPAAPDSTRLVAEPTEGDPTANAPSGTSPEAGKDSKTAAKIKAN